MSSFPFHIKTHEVECQHIREWPRATANAQEDTLHLHVKQYIPKDNPNPKPGDITIIGAHACGFSKELYEALWADLHAQLQKDGGPRIRSIWIADMSNHGYSGVLNEDVMGDEPCWHDHSRDLLHMTNVFRSEMPRPIIGIGHSYGANILTHLSLLHPRLLSTLVLLDPTIIAFDPKRLKGPGVDPARLSAFRRDIWPSRKDAEIAFRKSPFYRSWDPRVLNAWVEHAVRELPTALHPDASPLPSSTDPKAAPATLMTTKHQELFTYFRPLWPHYTNEPSPTVSKAGAPDYDTSVLDTLPPGQEPSLFYRSEGSSVLNRLPEVRPSVLYLFGETSDLSTPELRDLRLRTTGVGPSGSGGVKEGRVKGILMEKKGHLFPMEIPGQCAEHAASWIGTEMQKFAEEQKAYEEWAKLPLREKSTLSETALKLLGPPPGSRKKETSGKAKL
ncbi:Alpha/beta hydrolase family-domain-containing protein [Xylariaceae sp. FL1272]|nr:Alpha/beta hydrolase family-domain-containing protein [Xylariaceae sp. FL1272]